MCRDDNAVRVEREGGREGERRRALREIERGSSHILKKQTTLGVTLKGGDVAESRGDLWWCCCG